MTPGEISRYHEVLLKIIQDEDLPHVLMRTFRRTGSLTCIDSKNLKLSAIKKKMIRNINCSPFPRLKKKLKERGRDFYQGRPKDVPEPIDKFSLDYDFDTI